MNISLYKYIYINIYRERERGGVVIRETRPVAGGPGTHMQVYIYHILLV